MVNKVLTYKVFDDLGMRSTQRCESMNSTLKTVMNEKIMLYKFVEKYDGVLENIRFEEDGDDYNSSHTFPVIEGILPEIKNEAAKAYTRRSYEVFCKEMSYEARHIVIDTKTNKDHIDGETHSYLLSDVVRKSSRYLVVHNIKINRMACCCMKLNSTGFPCRHMFAVMKFKGMTELPQGCILRRWTMRAKLHITNSTEHLQLQKDDDEKAATGRYAFLITLSCQLCRMVSTSYERSTWLRDKLAKMLLDTERDKVFPKKKDVVVETKVKRKGKGTKRKTDIPKASKDSNEKSDAEKFPAQFDSNFGGTHMGFVDLLKRFIPRTYEPGEASSAKDCYEVSAFHKVPTIFDWDPSNHY